MTARKSRNSIQRHPQSAAVSGGMEEGGYVSTGEAVPPQRHTSLKRIDWRHLEVTEADIVGAVAEDSRSCMIADAIKRQVPGAQRVSVDMGSIRLTDARNRRLVFLTPPRCQSALIAFDLGVRPKPFRFSLSVAQVTTPRVDRKKRDADGRVVIDPDTGKPVRERKSPSRKATVKAETAGSVPVKIGGQTPPRHPPSWHRRFGAKGFTWRSGEDPNAVADRLQLTTKGVEYEGAEAGAVTK